MDPQQREGRSGQGARAASSEDVWRLIVVCVVCSMGGSVAGFYLGMWLSDPPVTPSDGPSIISAVLNGLVAGLVGLLAGPLSMALVKTDEPLREQRVTIGILTPVCLVILAVCWFFAR